MERTPAGQARRVRASEIASLSAHPAQPALSVMRFDPRDPPTLRGLHAHDHMALGYFEVDGGWLTSPTANWRLYAGDVVVIGPGEPIDAHGLADATGWGVFFSPTAVSSAEALLAWQTHPLLYPFVAGHKRHPLRGRVDEGDRGWWSDRCRELDAELRHQLPGHREAAVAQLTLLLVAITRLFEDHVGHLRAANEPILTVVFDRIEHRFRESLALKEVAAAVGLTPGYLTTLVRRKTGRTVQAWIAERRMAEARHSLVTTDMSIDELAHHLGYTDGPYFVRQFKRLHGTTPAAWRRLARSTSRDGGEP